MKPFFLLFFSSLLNTALFGQTLPLLTPPPGCVYHGAVRQVYENPQNPLAGYFSALGDTAIYPSVQSYFMGIPGVRNPMLQIQGLRMFFSTADSFGFIPEVSLFLNDSVSSTDSIIAHSTQYDWMIDSLVAICSGYGRRMFLRIGGEFNGIWNGYHPYDYVTMFRKIVNRFVAANFRDSIATNWCYMPAAANDFDSSNANGFLWYPGDAFTDWFGLDVFGANNFDQSLPDSSGGVITMKGKANRFLEMATIKGKPVYLNETSAKSVHLTPDSTDSQNDWNAWFAKFWNFMDLHPEIRGFNYINANWPPASNPGWGDARIQVSPWISSRYRTEMYRTKYLHLGGRGCAGPANIENRQSSAFVSVFPNPAGTLVQFEFSAPIPGEYSLSVLGMDGILRAGTTVTIPNQGLFRFSLPVEGFPSGVYVFHIRGMGRVWAGKWVKE